MKLIKERIYKDEYVLKITENFQIPIRDSLIIIMICALFAYAHNEAMVYAQNLSMYVSYVSDYGIWSPADGRYLKCIPVADDYGVLNYQCENRTGSSPLSQKTWIGYNLSELNGTR